MNNQYVTEWSWFVNDDLVGVDSNLMMRFDTSGVYTIKLAVSDGCFEQTSESSFRIYASDTLAIEEILCLGDTLYWNTQVITQEGEYVFTSINQYGCDSLTRLNVQLEESFTVIDTNLCIGEIFVLDDEDFIIDTVVRQVLSSIHLCDSIIEYQIQFIEDCGKCKLQVPLAFTPNNDNINDMFGLINPCNLSFTSFTIQIYSRWGELVFNSTESTDHWDGNYKGKPAMSEVYLMHISGQLVSGGYVDIKGDLTLIR